MKREIKTLEFNQSLQGFKLRLKQQGKSMSSQIALTNHLQEFLSFIELNGIRTIKEINQKSLNLFWDYLLNERKNKRTNQPIASSYILKFRESILRYMEYLTDSRLGESNFQLPIIKPQAEIKEILTKQEIKQLFDSCENTLEGMTDKCILALLYGCGLRRKELSTLEVHEIDLKKGLIRLSQTKTKHQRDVVMSPSVLKIVEQYIYTARNMMLSNNSKESLLLVTQKGFAMSHDTIPFRLNRMSERANLGRYFGSHLLRHSIATHLMSELTLEQVALFLGQRSLDSTMIYTHLSKL